MALERKPARGQVWRHFKGGTYLVQLVARDCDTLEDVVVYRGDHQRTNWTRRRSEFLDVHPSGVNRFERLA